MGNAAQMQTQAMPPAVLNLAAMKAKHGTGTGRDRVLQEASPAQTYGVTPQVFPPAASEKPSARDCTVDQLFEIVLQVARGFRAAKDVVAEHRDYILRLKAEVFRVRFGSLGARVPVRCMAGGGLARIRKMTWKEFCESQFGVSADWINRLCGGKAGHAAPGGRGGPEPPRLDGRQQAELVRSLVAANELAAALRGGADWRAPLAAYKQVAVSPARLEALLNGGGPEPDWKAVAVRLVHALGQCGDSLPGPARDALDAARQALRGQPVQKEPAAGTPRHAGATGLPARAAINGRSKVPCAAPSIAYPGSKARVAPILVGYMPREGRSYLEPFAGLGNVFWAAASSRVHFERWVLNDIRTTPFLEAVRDIGGTLEVPARSREEGCRQWEAFKRGDQRAILLEPYLTFNGSGYGSGWRGRNGPTAAGYARTLRACHALLRATNAVITDCDWAELDWPSLSPDDFAFIDPPYDGADVQPYGENDIDHEELVRLLKAAEFKWMLTEYPNELYYRELGEPFFVKDVQLNAVKFRATGGRDRRLECAWKNY